MSTETDRTDADDIERRRPAPPSPVEVDLSWPSAVAKSTSAAVKLPSATDALSTLVTCCRERSVSGGFLLGVTRGRASSLCAGSQSHTQHTPTLTSCTETPKVAAITSGSVTSFDTKTEADDPSAHIASEKVEFWIIEFSASANTVALKTSHVIPAMPSDTATIGVRVGLDVGTGVGCAVVGTGVGAGTGAGVGPGGDAVVGADVGARLGDGTGAEVGSDVSGDAAIVGLAVGSTVGASPVSVGAATGATGVGAVGVGLAVGSSVDTSPAVASTASIDDVPSCAAAAAIAEVREPAETSRASASLSAITVSVSSDATTGTRTVNEMVAEAASGRRRRMPMSLHVMFEMRLATTPSRLVSSASASTASSAAPNWAHSMPASCSDVRTTPNPVGALVVVVVGVGTRLGLGVRLGLGEARGEEAVCVTPRSR